MDWKDKRNNYQGCGGKGVALKDADFAARRVLSGLGYTASQLAELETRLFSATYFDETLWSRACRIWSQSAHARPFTRLQCVEPSQLPSRKAEPNATTAVMVARIGDTAIAEFWLDQRQPLPGWLRPRFTVAAVDDAQNQLLVLQELQQFVKNVGGGD